MAGQFAVTVVTSDRAVQMSALGDGAFRLSARDFYAEEMCIRDRFCAHYGITWSIALESSGIKEWKDFEGKKVAIGAPGSNDAYLAENIFFPMAGVDKDKVDIEYLTMSEALTQMKDGHLDAYIGTAAPGLASMVDMASSRDTRFVPMSQEAIDLSLIHI